MNHDDQDDSVLEVDFDDPEVKHDSLLLSPQERQNFESHIDRSGGPLACWPWTGSRIKTGYGNLGLRGKTQKSHRVAHRLWNGRFDERLCVCHRCDNPPCCNPAHLWTGTIADNSMDKYRKGRANPATGSRNASISQPEKLRRGSDHGRAKLTESSVVQLRAMYASGAFTLSNLAEKFGISISVAHFAIKRKTWAHVP